MTDPTASQADARRPDRWQVGRALVGAGLALLAAASYAPVFGYAAADALTDRRFGLPVLGVVATMAAVSLLLAAGTRLAPVSRLATALAVLAMYVLLVVAPGRAVAGGARRLLTSALPLEPAGPELAVVVIVVGLAAVGAVEPALRRRAALLPALAPLAATGLGAAVSAGTGPPPGWLAPAFVLGGLALLLLRPAPRSAGPVPGPVRRVLAAGIGLAVIAGVTAAGWYGPDLLPGRSAPVDPRQLVPQPVTPREATSPLVLFPALRTGERELSLTVHASHRLDRLRYVSLDRFDGQYWTTTAHYQRAGRQLPLAPQGPAGPARQERVEVTAAGPLGWLVSSGRPVRVSLPDLGVNRDTGDVVLPAGRPVPTAYTVDSVQSEPDPELLAVATPSSAAVDDVLLSTDVGRGLISEASTIAGSAGYGYPALHAVEEHLRGMRVDSRPDAPGGHGLAQIGALLAGQVGTAEQYASAYAVLARALGYQSRVVVGFRPEPVDGQPGAYRVTGPTVHAWAEVRFEVLGWVRFDPTPDTESSDPGEPEPEPDGVPDSPPEPDSRDPDHPPGAAGGSDGSSGGLDAGRLARAAGLALTGLLGLLALGGVAVPAGKAMRRYRRRRARDPGGRALGAWRDTLDRLGEAGVAVTRADTTGEVTAETVRWFDQRVSGPVARLAVLHDAAAYAPDRLSGTAATAAWREADLVRRAVRGSLRPVRRLRAALSLRPLRG